MQEIRLEWHEKYDIAKLKHPRGWVGIDLSLKVLGEYLFNEGFLLIDSRERKNER